MHFGLLIYDNLDAVTGSHIYARHLVAQLQRDGDTVEVISLPRRTYRQHLADNFSRHLIKQLKQASYDALLQDEMCHASLFWLNRRLRRQVDYPIVSLVHRLHTSAPHPGLFNRVYRAVERRYLHSVDGLVYNSHTTHQAAEILMGGTTRHVVAHPPSTRLNPNTAPPEAIVSRAWKPGPLQVLYVGDITRRRWFHTLLTAVAQLDAARKRGRRKAQPYIHLTVVGEMESEPNYVRLIKDYMVQYELQDQISMLGLIPNDKLAEYMADSHVLVVPSPYEGFSMACLEGMGFGLPAIAATTGAAHELVTHEKNGFLIDIEDEAAIAKHLSTLIGDRDQLAHMSLAAQKRYLAHPTWEDSTASIRDFIRTLTK